MSVSLIMVMVAIAGSQPIYGIALSADGDSLSNGGQRIRLFGIDAPEFDQSCTRAGSSWACGQAASDQLAKLVTGREVRCVPTGTDAFDRVLARCSTVGGLDVNRSMVASGHAVAFRKYSMEYVSAETAARNAKRGLWSGTFDMPSEVRAGAQETVQPRQAERRPTPVRTRTATFSGGCVIKGNHSPRGEFIYHLPDMPYYSRTRAEQMFCSESQAQAAGYRRAKVRY